MPLRVCFVCSGNICRSPTAEVVLRFAAANRGIDVEVDSAGTGGWHVGEEMDDRSRATLVQAGYAPGTHAAKQFGPDDFAERDLVVALDSGHLRELRNLASATDEPAQARDKIVLLRSFDPTAEADADVADPYYGGRRGFVDVLEQIERACDGLLDRVSNRQQDESPCL